MPSLRPFERSSLKIWKFQPTRKKKVIFSFSGIVNKKSALEEEEPESGEILDDEKESTEYYNKSTSFFDNISCEESGFTFGSSEMIFTFSSITHFFFCYLV